ncbi:MAG: hypothetical protein Q9159_006296 [Coniocarpon cinnabarinum]
MVRRRLSRSGVGFDERLEKIPVIAGFDGSSDASTDPKRRRRGGMEGRQSLFLALLSLAIIGAMFGLLWLAWKKSLGRCDNYWKGFWCLEPTAQLWGQYSPYFDVSRTDVMRKDKLDRRFKWTRPPNCYYDVVSVLSRHGARGPTQSKNDVYNATVEKIQDHLTGSLRPAQLKEKYRFLRTYRLKFEPDELNDFGRKQMENSGKQVFFRYGEFVSVETPFIRASDQHRVVESAERWRKGLVKAHNGITKDPSYQALFPHGVSEESIEIHTIPECDACNNTLDHSRCTIFEEGVFNNVGDNAQACFANNAFTDLTDNLNKELSMDRRSTPLNVNDTINLMQLCAFDTLGSKHPDRQLSPFCGLFNKTDFLNLDYHQTLGKYYSFGHGNQLGPTQGVGWVNELVARLNDSAVHDETSTNRTLDADRRTFPLPRDGYKFFADFSHDNDLVAAVSALGLYTGINMDTSHRLDLVQTKGFSSSWVCPFAARVYVEKLVCPTLDWKMKFSRRYRRQDQDPDQKPLVDSALSTVDLADSRFLDDEEGIRHLKQSAWTDDFVRVIINDRVMPMDCQSEQYSEYGLCTLDKFLEQLQWARNGGNWSQCFEHDNHTHSAP